MKKLYNAEESMRYLQRHEKALTALEPIASILQSDPQEHDQLTQDYQYAKEEQQRYQLTSIFAGGSGSASSTF